MKGGNIVGGCDAVMEMKKKEKISSDFPMKFL